MVDPQQITEWRSQLQPDHDGYFSVYLPMQKTFRTQNDVRDVFKEYGEILIIKQSSSNFFIKYKEQDAALSAITAHHKSHQANVGISKVIDHKPFTSNRVKEKEKRRLEEDNRGLYTIGVQKKNQTKDGILKVFTKYGEIHDPTESAKHVYIRYNSRKMAEEALEKEAYNFSIHVPEIYFKYRKKPAPRTASPVATSSQNGSGDGHKSSAPTLPVSELKIASPVKVPPPIAFSDKAGGDMRVPTEDISRPPRAGLTLDMIRACVQEQIQLQTDSDLRGSTISSVDYADTSLCDLFPVNYAFLGVETDITRETEAEDILQAMLKPIAPADLRKLQLSARTRFTRAHTFVTAYDMNLEYCLNGGAGGGATFMAGLSQLQTFVQRKHKELENKPGLLRSLHAMNRAVMKLTHATPSQPAFITNHHLILTANLWRQWLQALNMAVIECGPECCLSYKSLTQSGELVTHTGRPTFALYRADTPAAGSSTDHVMHTLMDLDREPVLIIDLFSPATTSQPSPLPDMDLTPTHSVIFCDFLELPNPALQPPAAFCVPGVWRDDLLLHIRHLLAVLQSKHTRNAGGANRPSSQYEAFGLIVLHQQDVYVSRLTAPLQYLVALKEKRPQDRSPLRAALSLSRWKLNFALPNHRQALADFITALL